jgi:cytochrome c peroxidase
MKKFTLIIFIVFTILSLSFNIKATSTYHDYYTTHIQAFIESEKLLLRTIQAADLSVGKDVNNIREQIAKTRLKLKENDFWLRYLEPIQYNKINGPLPVEWETEVFEKFEKPYKRNGAGLTLAELYLDEPSINKDSLVALIDSSSEATKAFEADSITQNLNSYHHFFLSNRLFLLNLSSIYTTGFECPTAKNIVPELRYMLMQVKEIYNGYNQSFPANPLSKEYLDLYDKTIDFVYKQPADYTQFDHFAFIKDYVNVLFKVNQQLINAYAVVSNSNNDYSLNNDCFSIFDKKLYYAQNIKGIYSAVEDEKVLEEIRQTGKQLFYDPILSGNNKRSCASCHKPDQYFADTTVQTSLAYDQQSRLKRNSISLLNSTFNQLIMLDGRHITLQDQAKEVLTNSNEMNSIEKELLDKVLSCKDYRDAFKKYLKLTPEENQVTLTHIISTLTLYYGSFSNYYAPFDDAINNNTSLDTESIKGFNLFMGKAQCGTCHFVPQFNGVKPPFVNSEFEVLGVPEDTGFTRLSTDSGRYEQNPSIETLHAFRTGTVRNTTYTKPYMHNGVFNSLNEVLNFYNAGGGAGKKLDVINQTLSFDPLDLTPVEKKEIIAFINSLNEKIAFDLPPDKLPKSSIQTLNSRKLGGEY